MNLCIRDCMNKIIFNEAVNAAMLVSYLTLCANFGTRFLIVCPLEAEHRCE